MKTLLSIAVATLALSASALSEWEQNLLKVDAKVKRYQKALETGNEKMIRQTMMGIQQDPIAVQWFNKHGTEAERQRFANDTRDIRDAAKKQIVEKTVEKWNNDVDSWNAANPDKPQRQRISSDDVTFYEATNAKATKLDANGKPIPPPKAQQDWDVTVQVKGKEVPAEQIQKVVDKAYYDAAGGKQTFGNKTPSEVARNNSVNAIDSRHMEAYKDPETLLKAKENGKYVPGESTPARYTYGEQFSDTMQYKSSDALEKGIEKSKMKGTPEGRLQGEYEQFRQATKQYDSIVKPQVESLGGKVDPALEERINVMKKVSNFEMSPEEAREVLMKKYGETPESVIQKASQQIEAAEKLRPAEFDNADKAALAKKTPAANSDLDAPKTKVDTDAPKTKVDTDVPKSPKVDTDAPKTKVKAADVDVDKMGKVLEAGGTILNIGQYGEAAKNFTDGINEDNWDKAKEGYKDTIMNVADDVTMGTASAGKNLVNAVNEGKGYFNEKDALNKQVQGSNYEQTLVHDLVTKGGYSLEDARQIAEGYTSGDEQGIARLESAYDKMGEKVPDKESVGMTWKETGEAIGDYAKDVAGAGADVVVGVGKTVANVGKGVVNAGEIAVGMTEKGVAVEVGSQMSKNLSGDNISAGAEVVGQMTKEIAGEAGDALKELVGIDKNADTKEHIVQSLTSQGATKEEAERVANEYIKDKENKGGGSSSVLKDFKNELAERSDEEKLEAQKQNIRDAIKDLQDDALAGDEDAAAKIDELRQQYRDLHEKENELKEAKNSLGDMDADGATAGGLKTAEGGELPAPDAGNSIADYPAGGSLGSFLDEKGNDLSNKTTTGLWLSQNVTQDREQAAINEEANDIAKGIVTEAANDANLMNRVTQSNAADQQYQDSWGKAVADGVQSGLEQGVSEFTGTFGAAAGDKASNKVFGHDRPRHHHDGIKHPDAQPASPDGDESADGGDGKKTPESAPEATEPANKPSGDKAEEPKSVTKQKPSDSQPKQPADQPKAAETKKTSPGTDETKEVGGKIKFTQPGSYTVSASGNSSSKSSGGAGGLKCCKCGGKALAWLVSGSSYYCYNCWGQRKSSDGKTLQQGLDELSASKKK